MAAEAFEAVLGAIYQVIRAQQLFMCHSYVCNACQVGQWRRQTSCRMLPLRRMRAETAMP